MNANLIIAIDGGAGTGTSTVAEEVSRALNVPHFNSGSMYRALAWEALRQGIDLADPEATTELAETVDMELRDGRAAVINGNEVYAHAYSEGMGPAASLISGHQGVRVAMVAYQRQLAEQSGAVMEGRDIGNGVFPNAPYKFYLVCEPAERVRRVNAGGRHHETIESLLARDKADEAHQFGTFTKAADAIEIDTTHISAAEVTATIVEHVIQAEGRDVATQ